MTHFLMHFKKIRAAASLGLLAGLTLMPVARAQNGTPQATNWQPWGQPITYTLTNGGTNTTLNMTVSKGPTTNDGLDWYLVAGPLIQSTNSRSTLTAMDLDILGKTEYGFAPGGQNANLYDAQPASTTFTDQKTLDIGANLGVASDGMPSAGVSLSYSNTLTASGPVTVGTANAGNEANFHFQYSTTSSLTMQYAAIFNVRHGQGLFLQITPDSWWNPTSGGTTNSYTQAFVVADFGAAPAKNSNGQIIQPAMGPQIVSIANNQCLTAGLGDQPVFTSACEPQNTLQRWYYTGSGHIVNVNTGNCLDIQGGADIPQGDAPRAGIPTVMITDTCTTGIQYSQNWQITTRQNTFPGMVIQGISNWIVSMQPPYGKLALINQPGQTDLNAFFYLQ